MGGGGGLKWNIIVYRLSTAHITQMHERESNNNKQNKTTKNKNKTNKKEEGEDYFDDVAWYLFVCQMIVIIGDSGDCGYAPCCTYDVDRALFSDSRCLLIQKQKN